jgi:hypothetical protein
MQTRSSCTAMAPLHASTRGGGLPLGAPWRTRTLMPEKMLGGPGSCGLLVAARDLFHHVPTVPGVCMDCFVDPQPRIRGPLATCQGASSWCLFRFKFSRSDGWAWLKCPKFHLSVNCVPDAL